MEKFKKRMEKYPNGTTMPSLSNQVDKFPTPQATDGSVGSVIADDDTFFYNESGNLRKVNKKGTEGSAGLARMVVIEKWPTPRQSEHKGCGKKGSKSHKHMLNRNYLCAVIQDNEEETKHLNPAWTELLMLWPENWTSLEPLKELNWDIDCSKWEQPIPRVKPKEKDHANRLKAIGNGQVPLCAAVAWEILE